MKKFFNRAFTKAIAVAAAASIVTGVLAGCNVQPDVEKEDVETGFQPVTQSVEIDNETFSMTVNGYEYDNNSKLLTVKVTATNASDHAVTINGSEGVTASVKAYADAITDLNQGKLKMTVNASNGLSIWNKTVPAKVGASDGVVSGNLYFRVDSEYKNWKAVTMIVNVVDNASKNKADISDSGKLEFVINR